MVSDECDEPTSCLVKPIVAYCSEVMYFLDFDFRGELGFLTCDDICMCIVKNSLSSSRLFLIPFMLTCSMMKLISLLLLGLCTCVAFVVL